MSETARAGGCLCGGVRYELRGPLRPVVFCHCSQCRKTSGHYVAATACPPDRLHVLADATLHWYASSENAERGFCGKCGSNLFWRPVDRGRVAVTAGTLDTPTGLEASAHIHVADASDYHVIADGLPQHAGPLPAGTDEQ